jgi:hypothetical protein
LHYVIEGIDLMEKVGFKKQDTPRGDYIKKGENKEWK